MLPLLLYLVFVEFYTLCEEAVYRSLTTEYVQGNVTQSKQIPRWRYFANEKRKKTLSVSTMRNSFL